MITLPISHLTTLDFHVQNISACSSLSCHGAENRRNTLLFIVSGSKKYLTEGDDFVASSGTVLFIPSGTSYCSQNIVSENESYHDIGVCFDLLDKDNGEILLEPGLYRDWNVAHNTASELFEELYTCVCETPAYIMRHKSLLLRILSSMIFGDLPAPAARSVVSPAIAFILQHYCENLPIKTYADQCNMSESHFRKKFVEFVGKSPLEYRNELRFAKARKMHAEGCSMQEIADSIGFFDASYFSKLYKKHHGHSLREERDGMPASTKNI